MKIIELFPTPVGVYDLGRKITKKEKSYIDLLLQSTSPNGGNKTSEDTFVLKQNELSSLENFCLESVNQFASQVLKYQKLQFRITQSWLNKSSQGEWHHLHNHPNSVLSGVLYIETGKEDKINFKKNGDRNSFLFEVDDWTMYNTENWWLPVKATELFIFPSHLFHSVPPTLSKSRISLSFNTFPVGSFGSVNSLCNLDL
jgi:uncharacterized protein (TIGR02466 family)